MAQSDDLRAAEEASWHLPALYHRDPAVGIETWKEFLSHEKAHFWAETPIDEEADDIVKRASDPVQARRDMEELSAFAASNKPSRSS
jgi:hypothetical protein